MSHDSKLQADVSLKTIYSSQNRLDRKTITTAEKVAEAKNLYRQLFEVESLEKEGKGDVQKAKGITMKLLLLPDEIKLLARNELLKECERIEQQERLLPSLGKSS